MRTCIISLLMILSLTLFSQKNEVGIGLNLVSVIECDSTGVYVWYAHSGKDVREYIEVKPLENNQQPIKEEELIIIKEL